MSGTAPGSLKGLQLVVPDVVAAHAELVARGVEVSDVQSVDGDADKVAQGGTALYYFSREKHIRAYREQTPAWIVEFQQGGGQL